MDKYNLILKKSKKFDDKYNKNIDLDNICINFKINSSHERYIKLKKYSLKSGKLDEFIKKNKNCTYLIDSSLKNYISIKYIKDFYFLKADEKNTKQLNYLNRNLLTKKYHKKLVVIGGGLLINVGAYIAQNLKLKLYLFPTTVLSMADSSGGKVRINHIIKNKFYKHYYKSFYEPDLMIVDKSFLYSLPINQKRNGLVEIIKHSLFQSSKLYDFLINNDVLKDDKLLLKAVFWGAELKKICLEEDISEKSDGSAKILRAGHNISDKIEEENRFEIPHGVAVAKGIIQQLYFEENYNLLSKAKKIFNKYKIKY